MKQTKIVYLYHYMLFRQRKQENEHETFQLAIFE